MFPSQGAASPSLPGPVGRSAKTYPERPRQVCSRNPRRSTAGKEPSLEASKLAHVKNAARRFWQKLSDLARSLPRCSAAFFRRDIWRAWSCRMRCFGKKRFPERERLFPVSYEVPLFYTGSKRNVSLIAPAGRSFSGGALIVCSAGETLNFSRQDGFIH